MLAIEKEYCIKFSSKNNVDAWFLISFVVRIVVLVVLPVVAPAPGAEVAGSKI